MTSEVDTLLRGLSESERAAFWALGQPVAFAEGEVILPAGRSEWDTYIIQQGEVSIWVGNACLAELQAGQTIGTSAILLPHLQWSSARGKTTGVLLRIPREELMAFLESRPQRVLQLFSINVFRIWVEVLNQRNARSAEIQRRIFAASLPSKGRRFKVLVVDDEAEILSVMEEFFREQYEVLTAKSGLEAMSQALECGPDLVLLDLRLPELDGLNVCRRLKADRRTGHVPIVMVSALSTVPDKVKGLMYGADEYLTKPVDLEQLDDTVKRVLARVYGE